MNHFHIVSVGRNTIPFIEAHLASTLGQDIPDYAVTWVDDASTDWGLDDIDPLTVGGVINRGRLDFTMIVNSKRLGGLANTLRVVRGIQPDDIAVLCSGDDELAHPNVLTRVAREYDSGALLTYGQFVMSTGEPGFCRQMTRHEHENPYSAPWVTTHLITFRAGLMQEIPDEFLRDEDGEYYDFAGDQAFMLYMLAHTPYEKCRFIPDVLLKYTRHPGNDDPEKSARAERRIREIGKRCFE